MSITTALKARREQLRDREAGFTLIELLVVVIIIGILAAIAIPVYIGVQNSAKDSSTTSDLANAKIAALAYYSANNAWSPIAPSGTDNAATTQNSAGKGGFGNYGWSSTSAVDASATAGGSSTAFCIKQTSGSGKIFYVTQSTAPTAATSAPSGCQ